MSKITVCAEQSALDIQYEADLAQLSNYTRIAQGAMSDIAADLVGAHEQLVALYQRAADLVNRLPEGLQDDPAYKRLQKIEKDRGVLTEEEEAFFYDQAGVVDGSLQDLRDYVERLAEELKSAVRHIGGLQESLEGHI